MIKHFLGSGSICPSEATVRHPIDLQKGRDIQNIVDLPPKCPKYQDAYKRAIPVIPPFRLRNTEFAHIRINSVVI